MVDQLSAEREKELARAICDELHEQVQFYDSDGKCANNSVLSQIEPVIVDVLKARLSVS